MPNLKHIWNKDPQGMLSFAELQKVTVFLCPNLKNIFPASGASSLLKLESLEDLLNVEELQLSGNAITMNWHSQIAWARRSW
ncbi:hypothetical protein Ddye_019107 [Dipteronia dyeriana]|uniref:Disease resistance protein At4g27190-like leucine-rich repeats domain-containing protein n=1 Tax=Dipteronia dyeriana TaxID=168575 RepID=A0AAD9TXH5_9ROSI|nr:hypothetical protein Ddye_019107 [Dipteronia dyeriana]